LVQKFPPLLLNQAGAKLMLMGKIISNKTVAIALVPQIEKSISLNPRYKTPIDI